MQQELLTNRRQLKRFVFFSLTTATHVLRRRPLSEASLILDGTVAIVTFRSRQKQQQTCDESSDHSGGMSSDLWWSN